MRKKKKKIIEKSKKKEKTLWITMWKTLRKCEEIDFYRFFVK